MNAFGTNLKVQLWGESHGAAVGVLIDGCPAGITVLPNDFDKDLLRRKSGARGTTERKESDKPVIQSGIHNNHTTGSPISILFHNKDMRSQDYNFREHPRPGHADFTAHKKYFGYNDDRGGGHFSGRITAGLVAAGVIAKKLLPNINIKAKLTEVGGITDIGKAIQNAIDSEDSVGGIIQCSVKGLPVGLGEPFFDSVESLVSHAVFSVPGIRGIEFGSGFDAAQMKGAEHNDIIKNSHGTSITNHAGGVNGGITNGNELKFRVAVKPTSSITSIQNTFHFGENRVKELAVKGRHDACFALRVPVIIEAVTALVLADLKLRRYDKN